MGRPPQIVAYGGGGFSMEAGNPLLDEYVLAVTGKPRPKVCFVPTASGDADHYIVRFYRAFGPKAECSHLSLFRRDRSGCGIEGDPLAHLLQQDIIYVGGGSVLSLLGAWRAHGLDRVLRRAWQRGVVLCGLSAGSLCWFADAVTAFHGGPKEVRGLGLLPYANCVHYDAEPVRRDAFRDLVARRGGQGLGAEDGVALHFVGHELRRVVSSREDRRAWLVEATGDGGSRERPLQADFLGAPPVALAA